MYDKGGLHMAETDTKNVADMVNDFLANSSHSEEECLLVFHLYSTLLDMIADNAVLEMENSMLTRQLEIAENAILRMEKEAKEPKYLA